MSYSPSVSLVPNKKTCYKDLYKSPISSPNRNCNSCQPDADGNLNWRSAYKKRCFDQFKSSRQKLINKFRDIKIESSGSVSNLKNYLEIELQKICLLEANTNPNLVLSVDQANEIYSQIQNELSAQLSDKDDIEIENILKNIENVDQLELDVLCCPVCKKSNVTEKDATIFCENSSNCIFKINNSKLTLSQLKTRIDMSMSQHEESTCCDKLPFFQFKNQETIVPSDLVMLQHFTTSAQHVSFFLLVSCESCNFLDIITA
jgi:hypothetical protein